MKNTIFLIISILVLVSCSKEEDAKPTNLELLAGTEVKEWYLYAISPEPELNSCKPLGSVLFDNTWTFFADGSFEFDHGNVTEDPDCMEEGCCCDLINITGTWEFTNNETGMKIMALHKTGDPDYVLDSELVNAKIDLLKTDKLQLSYTNPDAELVEETMEFRIRE